MRKRNFKFALSEIFWNIVAFLPVIMGLFSLIAFGTDNFINALAKSEEKTEIETTVKETVAVAADTSTLLNKVVIFKNDVDFYEFQGGMGSISFSLEFFTVKTVDGVEIREDFTSLIVAMDHFGGSGSQLFYGETCVYDDGYDPNDGVTVMPGWIDDGYCSITIIGGADVESGSTLDFFIANAYCDQWIESVTDYVPPVEEAPDVETETLTFSVYDYMKDGFDSAMRVVGYTPENDILYGVFSKLFVTGDVFPIFRESAFILQFVCYFIYVHILRFFVDLLLWIPNFARKLVNEGFKGD